MKSRPEARCPLRPEEICSLCQMGVTGPQDCGLVYLAMGDDDLRAEFRARSTNQNPGSTSTYVPRPDMTGQD